MAPLPENPPERESRRARFEPGDEIGARYRVVSSWGAGRLDEAYHVEDAERGGHVVLRVLRRSRRPLQPSRALTRLFARLTKLRHPNLARYHDLAVHVVSRPGRGDESILYVTSDLVTGETLGSHVRRSRPLDPEVARSLIDGICAGLAAAHRANLIHGNLSSAEVTLRDDGTLHPVITDFGLFVRDDDLGAMSVGPPVYKAPETLVGRPSDEKSDVFSLGAIIYEILSGRIPFTGGNLLALDFRRLEEEPRPLGELVENLDPIVERVVARCLNREPEDRYSSAGEVRKALLGSEMPTPRTRRNVSTLGLAAVLVAVMFGGSALLNRLSELERLRPPLEVTSYRPSFAILDLAPTDDATDPWIATALSHLLREDFAHDGSLRVAEDALVNELMGAVSPMMGIPDEDLLARIRLLFEVEAVLVGTCSVDHTAATPLVSLDLCVIDARSGEILAAAFERGSPESLPELAARTASRLRASVSLPDLGPSSIRWDPDAVRPWAYGRILLGEHRPREALRHFELAAGVQPGNPHIHDQIARAWAEIGSAAPAADASRRALELSKGDVPEQVLLRRATLARLEGDVSGVITVIGQLARAFPDRSTYAFDLIDTMLQTGATKSAAEEIRRLRAARAVIDPRIEILDARLNLQLGRLDAARSHAEKGATIAGSAGSATLRAAALAELAWVLELQGDTAAARFALGEAESALEQSGNLSGLTRIGSARAQLLQRRGEPDAAVDAWRSLAARFRAMGREQGYATALASQANALTLLGRHREALAKLVEASAKFDELGDDSNLARALGMSGSALLSLGRLPEARKTFQAAAETSSQGNHRAWEAYACTGLARIAIERLDLDEAQRQIARAISIFEGTSLPSQPALLLVVMSELDRVQGDPGTARDRLRNAASDPDGGGLNRDQLAEIRLGLAAAGLWSGTRREALTHSEMALEHFVSTGNLDRQADALILALTAATALGDHALARVITERLDRLTGRIESPARKLRARLARAASFDPAVARAERLAVRSHARTLGLELLGLEAAWALENGAIESLDRDLWSTEVSTVARRTGAHLFLGNPAGD